MFSRTFCSAFIFVTVLGFAAALANRMEARAGVMSDAAPPGNTNPACCFADGTCQDVDPAGCVDQGGTPNPQSVCLPQDAEKMYWTAVSYSVDDVIQRANRNGTGVMTVVTLPQTPNYSMRGIALDSIAEKMYWLEDYAFDPYGRMRRADRDGSNVEVVIPDGLKGPLGIALDPAAGKVYWTNNDFGVDDQIRRANLDGSDIEDVVTGLTVPGGIALDLADEQIYWTEQGSGRIRRAALNGGGVEDLLITPFPASPVDIALDVPAGKMYWTDVGINKIRRANLDGSQVEDLITVVGLGPLCIAIDAAEGKMYWADIQIPGFSGRIRRANLNGTQIETLVNTGQRDPVRIALVEIACLEQPQACCLPGRPCELLSAAGCANQGGILQGTGTVCEGDADGDGVDGICGDLCPNDKLDDTDGDGVCDSADTCPDGDDGIDTDGDGRPNACDPCPNDPDNDTDGDGVCDFQDVCQGGNDSMDADADGIPDFCDPCPLGPNTDSDADGVCDIDDRCPGEDDTIDSDHNNVPDCLQAIPTVSAWGVVMMALLLLTAWKIYFRPEVAG